MRKGELTNEYFKLGISLRSVAIFLVNFTGHSYDLNGNISVARMRRGSMKSVGICLSAFDYRAILPDYECAEAGIEWCKVKHNGTD